VVYTQTFDAENWLVAITTPTGTVQFRYDGDGNRLLRIGPEGATVYIGDYYEKRGSVVTKYYYAAGQRVALRVGGWGILAAQRPSGERDLNNRWRRKLGG